MAQALVGKAANIQQDETSASGKDPSGCLLATGLGIFHNLSVRLSAELCTQWLCQYISSCQNLASAQYTMPLLKIEQRRWLIWSHVTWLCQQRVLIIKLMIYLLMTMSINTMLTFGLGGLKWIPRLDWLTFLDASPAADPYRTFSFSWKLRCQRPEALPPTVISIIEIRSEMSNP